MHEGRLANVRLAARVTFTATSSRPSVTVITIQTVQRSGVGLLCAFSRRIKLRLLSSAFKFGDDSIDLCVRSKRIVPSVGPDTTDNCVNFTRIHVWGSSVDRPDVKYSKWICWTQAVNSEHCCITFIFGDDRILSGRASKSKTLHIPHRVIGD